MKAWLTETGQPGVEFDDHDTELIRVGRDLLSNGLHAAEVLGLIGTGTCQECGQDAVVRPFPLLNADGGVYISDLCADCQLGKCQDLEAKARANTPPEEAESEEVDEDG